jgi:hypothetical protein
MVVPPPRLRLPDVYLTHEGRLVAVPQWADEHADWGAVHRVLSAFEAADAPWSPPPVGSWHPARCLHCNGGFLSASERGRFCSNACQTAWCEKQASDTEPPASTQRGMVAARRAAQWTDVRCATCREPAVRPGLRNPWYCGLRCARAASTRQD